MNTNTIVRPIICALMSVFLITGVAAAAMAGNAEEQLEQDAYEKIIKSALRLKVGVGLGEGKQKIGKNFIDTYRKNKRTKVLAACIYWRGNSVGDLRIGPWWSSYKGIDSRSFLGDLRRQALNNCKSKAKGDGRNCKCQIVDENDKNKLKLPEDWVARVLAR